MELKLFEGEKFISEDEIINLEKTDIEISEKYEKGQHRIITENGTLKLSQVVKFFNEEKIDLKPPYQRNYVWDNKRKSRLIESFIINIPIPPIFMIESEYDSYKIMDGLQRVTTIIDFYNNKFKLEELNEWSELNGKKYESLPQKLKEGIDRRQLSYVTVLKESSSDEFNTQRLEKLVFERLNTGGIGLKDQEIRNALYLGKFNTLCQELALNENYRNLMEFSKKNDLGNTDEDIEITNIQNLHMEDVELVLRFFAMRHYKNWKGNLNTFLDNMLKVGNEYSDTLLEKLKNQFSSTMEKIEKYFGKNAFSVFKQGKWSKPQKYIFDSLSLFIQIFGVNDISKEINENKKKLEKLYIDNIDFFNGKKQSRSDIDNRINLFRKYLIY